MDGRMDEWMRSEGSWLACHCGLAALSFLSPVPSLNRRPRRPLLNCHTDSPWKAYVNHVCVRTRMHTHARARTHTHTLGGGTVVGSAWL